MLSPGLYNVGFDFTPAGTGASADVVIDRVYIAASDSGGGTPIGVVPEPTTLSLVALGCAGLVARRRKRQA